MARHTPYVTAVMARNLAHQGEAKAHSTIATFTHTGGTVKRRKNTLAFLLWQGGASDAKEKADMAPSGMTAEPTPASATLKAT